MAKSVAQMIVATEEFLQPFGRGSLEYHEDWEKKH